MDIKISKYQDFCIYCRKSLLKDVASDNQFHLTCYQAIKEYSPKNLLRYRKLKRLKNRISKFLFDKYVTLYYGYIRQNLLILNVISKKALVFTGGLYCLVLIAILSIN